MRECVRRAYKSLVTVGASPDLEMLNTMPLSPKDTVVPSAAVQLLLNSEEASEPVKSAVYDHEASPALGEHVVFNGLHEVYVCAKAGAPKAVAVARTANRDGILEVKWV